MALKFLAGLGNSGAEYALTRHNAGAIALSVFAESMGAELRYDKYLRASSAKVRTPLGPLVLAFAEGYMNESGANLQRIIGRLGFRVDEFAVLCDDINLEVGRIKLSVGGSAGGHNGLADIMEHCGNSFARVRIGVGAKPDKRMDLADYVLGRLPESDLSALRSLDIKECVMLMISKGVAAAQNLVNRRCRADSASARESANGEARLSQ